MKQSDSFQQSTKRISLLEEENANLLKQVKILEKTINSGFDKEAKKYHAIFDQAPVGIATIDSHSGRFAEINCAYCNIVGYSKTEMLGMDFMQITHPSDLEEDLDNMKRIRSGEVDSFRMKKRYLHKGGEIVWVNLTVVPLWEEGSEPTFHLAIVNDITNFIAAKEAIEKNQALLDATESVSKIGGWEWDVESETMFWTNETYRIHGYYPGEIDPGSSKHIERSAKCYDQEDRPLILSAFQDCIEKGKAYDLDFPFTKTTGERIWIRTIAKPVYENDRVVKVIGNIMDITDRKLTEYSLRTSKRRLKQANEMAKLGHWVWEMPANELLWSDEVYQIYGRDKDRYQPTAESFEQCIHPSDYRDYLNERKTALMEHRSIDIEHRIILPDGSTRHVRQQAEIRQNEHGEVIALSGTVQDISEQKMAEKKIQHDADILRTITDTMQETLSVISLDGEFIYANKNATKNMSGGMTDTIIGENIRVLLPKNQAENLIKLYQETYDSGKPISREISVELKKGKTYFFNTLKPLDYGLKKKPAVLSVSLDITDRVQSEKNLRKSERKYRKLFEESRDAIFIIDKKTGRYLDANQAGEKITGRSLSELKKITTKEVTPQGATQRLDYLDLKNESIDLGEVVYVQPGGSKRYAELVSVPLDDRTVYGIAKDITDRKKMEKSIRESQRMESIGNLAGGIAHDFNNLLFPIVGMAEMLLEDLAKDSPLRENAEEIYRAGSRGSDLVKQILAFSRQSEHKMIPTRIQNVLNEVIKLSKSTIPSYIEVNQDIQQDCGMVMADSSQIHQICMNIITNAYHALEDAGGKISIALKQSVIDTPELFDINLSAGTYAVLSISDTGHGMSQELIRKIFNPYFTTKKQGKGTGLGLAVVYGIVKDHSGDIKVYSEIGKGSTFEIFLPLLEEYIGTQLIHTTEDDHGGNERILLVDDEESIIKLEKRMLERMGYQVTSRLHSIEALEAFKANPSKFDLVVTDMSMPNIPGDELARSIKSVRSDVPIILCTGFSERLRKDNIKSMGIDALLMKPIMKSELTKTIRKVLDEAKTET